MGRVRRIAKWLSTLLLAPVLLFLLAAWIGSSIPRNGAWVEPEDGVTLFIASNGIHTEIVMPLDNDAVDWRAHFPLSDITAPNGDYTHISVSWGERSFFLETPTWAEFELSTGVSAMVGGEALLHVAWYEAPAPRDQFRKLRVTQSQYVDLSKHILADLPDAPEVFAGYGKRDAFYSARGTYHLANTCNQWTSDRLAGAGIRTGWWTPFPGGVMKWVPQDS